MWILCTVFSWVLRSINWRWILWNRYILYATYHVKICVCAECMLNKNRISIKLRVQSKIEYLFCFVNRLVHFTLTYLLPFGGFLLNEHSFGMEWLRFKVVLIYMLSDMDAIDSCFMVLQSNRFIESVQLTHSSIWPHRISNIWAKHICLRIERIFWIFAIWARIPFFPTSFKCVKWQMSQCLNSIRWKSFAFSWSN